MNLGNAPLPLNSIQAIRPNLPVDNGITTIASTSQRIADVVTKYKDAESPGLYKTVPSGASRAMEVVSWVQVPLIIQQLQKPDGGSILLSFPVDHNQTDPAIRDAIYKEQREIHDFISSFHSKPLDMVISQLKDKIAGCYEFKTSDPALTDDQRVMCAEEWVNTRGLAAQDKQQLKITHIIDSRSIVDVERTFRKAVAEAKRTKAAKPPPVHDVLVEKVANAHITGDVVIQINDFSRSSKKVLIDVLYALQRGEITGPNGITVQDWKTCRVWVGESKKVIDGEEVRLPWESSVAKLPVRFKNPDRWRPFVGGRHTVKTA